jgi:hypothetical protein
LLSQIPAVRSAYTRADFYDELEDMGFFKNNNYELLMDVTDEDEVVRFYAKDAGGGKISELLLVIGGNDYTLISIRGLIDPENIGKITGTLNIEVNTGDSGEKEKK